MKVRVVGGLFGTLIGRQVLSVLEFVKFEVLRALQELYN
jgi:hypothetical protein